MADAHIDFRPGRFGRPAARAGLWVQELTDAALASVVARRMLAARASAAAEAAFRTSLPAAGQAALGADFAFLWSGPGHWLALAPASSADVESRLTSALAGTAAVFDQGDGRVLLDVGGPRVRDVLAKGVSLDLGDRAFPTGSVALTAVSHLNVTLWRVDDTPRYRLLVVRTYFDSFWRWLSASAAEYGGELRPSEAYSHPGALPGR